MIATPMWVGAVGALCCAHPVCPGLPPLAIGPPWSRFLGFRNQWRDILHALLPGGTGASELGRADASLLHRLSRAPMLALSEVIRPAGGDHDRQILAYVLMSLEAWVIRQRQRPSISRSGRHVKRFHASQLRVRVNSGNLGASRVQYRGVAAVGNRGWRRIALARGSAECSGGVGLAIITLSRVHSCGHGSADRAHREGPSALRHADLVSISQHSRWDCS